MRVNIATSRKRVVSTRDALSLISLRKIENQNCVEDLMKNRAAIELAICCHSGLANQGEILLLVYGAIMRIQSRASGVEINFVGANFFPRVELTVTMLT
jgi:hypothetical protein